jgi:pimeloyl-ACP methyl ester carboxylesterase
MEVLAIDLRGHGGSAKQGKTDLAPRVQKRDAKLFQDMHKDAIAAVRYLVREAACDPAKICIVGASVGCSVAIDTARRYPKEIAAVACLSPGSNYLGLDTLEHAKTWPKDKPLLLLNHKSEEGDGAAAVQAAIAGSRLVTYDDAEPESAKGDASWAHGTKMFGRIPLVEQTVASFLAARTGSKKDDVVLDGVVAADGPDADPWSKAVDVGGGFRAYRVGRRVVFGGPVPEGSAALVVMLLQGKARVGEGEEKREVPVFPTVTALDLATGKVAWSVPTAEDMKDAPVQLAESPAAFRIVKGGSGATIEGEWMGATFKAGARVPDPGAMKCILKFESSMPEPPSKENPIDASEAVELKSR